MRKKTMRRFTFLIFLLFLTNIAHAADKCAETSFQDQITIVNNYGSTVHYDVSISGRASVFAELNSENSFFLNNAEAKVIRFETYLPFVGDYDLIVTVKDSKGGEVRRDYPFNVLNCHYANASIILDNHYCEKEPVNYTLVIENTGMYNETLNINVGGYAFTAKVNIGQTKEYPLIFNSMNHSDKTIALKVENNNINIAKKYNLNITNCDSLSYSLNNVRFCEGMLKQEALILKNTGIHNDTYELSTNSGLLQLNETIFDMPRGKEKVVGLNLSSECGQEGNKITSIKLKSQLLGEIIIPVSYEVVNCYDQEIQLFYEKTDYCETDNKKITAMIENTGSEESTYTARLLFGENSTSRNITLKSKEKYNITLEYNNISSNDFQVSFESVSEGICYSKLAKEEVVSVNSYDECYSARLELQPNFFDNKTKAVVRNNGTRANTYNISISAYNLIDSKVFELSAGESASFTLNQLMGIHDEFGVDNFQVTLSGKGIDVASNTTYYDNSITGMISRTAGNASFLLGLTTLLIISYAFLGKK